MQVKAIYENGMINFEKPLRFKHSKFEGAVNIPEAEFEDLPVSNSISATEDVKDDCIQDSADMLLTKIKRILGHSYRKPSGSNVEQDKATYFEALVEKYGK